MYYGSQLHTSHEATTMMFRRYETRASGLHVVSDLGQTVVQFASGYQSSGLLTTPNQVEISRYGGTTQRIQSDPSNDTIHDSLVSLRSDAIRTWQDVLDGSQNATNAHHQLATLARVVDERSPGGVILPNTERVEFVGNVATPDEIDVIENITTHVQDLVTRNSGEIPGNYM